MAKNRIEELKTELEIKKVEVLRLKHQNERLEIEETHLAEFNNFNFDWDNKMREYSTHGLDLQKALEDK
jgi:hypothetical protein